MNKLQRLLQLPPPLRNACLNACCLLVAIELALRVIPFRYIYALLKELQQRMMSPTQSSLSLDQALWAINAAERVLGRSKPDRCLPQALLACFFLQAQGYPARLRFGVKKNGSTIDGHAWVDCHGKIVVGGHDSQDLFYALSEQTVPERN